MDQGVASKGEIASSVQEKLVMSPLGRFIFGIRHGLLYLISHLMANNLRIAKWAPSSTIVTGEIDDPLSSVMACRRNDIGFKEIAGDLRLLEEGWCLF